MNGPAFSDSPPPDPSPPAVAPTVAMPFGPVQLNAARARLSDRPVAAAHWFPHPSRRSSCAASGTSANHSSFAVSPCTPHDPPPTHMPPPAPMPVLSAPARTSPHLPRLPWRVSITDPILRGSLPLERVSPAAPFLPTPRPCAPWLVPNPFLHIASFPAPAPDFRGKILLAPRGPT